jgi:hypothetical protein
MEKGILSQENEFKTVPFMQLNFKTKILSYRTLRYALYKVESLHQHSPNNHIMKANKLLPR